MANIVLHASDLLEAARKMEDAATRISDALDRLNTVVGDIESVWSDQNSKKYLDRYNELKEEFPGFKAAVHSYSEFLNAVVRTYQQEYIDEVSTTV